MPARDSKGRFVARRNMAGRPRKHGMVARDLSLLDEDAYRFVSLPGKMLKDRAKAGSSGAKYELAARKKDRSSRAGTAPHSRIIQRKSISGAHGPLAPGFSLQQDFVKGSAVWHILYNGRQLPNGGKYAMSPAKAAELTHKIDPATGKRFRPAWSKEGKSASRKAAANPWAGWY